MGGGRSEETCEAVLRGLWVLGEGEVYEVWRESLCSRVFECASGGVFYKIWGMKGLWVMV